MLTVDSLLKERRLSLLKSGQSVYLTAHGMSMYPFLKSYDKLKIEPSRGSDVRTGDVVAVDRKNGSSAWFVVHRVVKISKSRDGEAQYFTKGDAQGYGVEGPVLFQDIVGRVVLVQRKGIQIRLDHPGMRIASAVFAKMSLCAPRTLAFLSRCISVVVERRWFFKKIENRLKNGDPLLHNTEKLLLFCAQKDAQGAFKERAADVIKDGVDWERFYAWALDAGMTSSVYESLKKLGSDVWVPRSILDALKADCFCTIRETASQYRETAGLLKSLATGDVPAAPLKGPFLSRRIYGDSCARGVSADIDLLIPEKEKERAREILAGAGYRSAETQEIPEWRWQYVLTKQGERPVDLHWNISIKHTQEMVEGLWGDARRVQADGLDHFEFSDDGLLLYLAPHVLNMTGLRPLRYLCDICALVRRSANTLNWNSIIEKARSWKLSDSLYNALSLCGTLFHLEIPVKVRMALRPSLAKRLGLRMLFNRKVLFRGGARRRFMEAFLNYIILEWVEARSFQDYTAIFKRVFFPPKEILAGRGPVLRIVKGALRICRKALCPNR